MLEDIIISQAVATFLAAISLRPNNSRLKRIALKVYQAIHATYGMDQAFKNVVQGDKP